jgi:hypothetical protein
MHDEQRLRDVCTSVEPRLTGGAILPSGERWLCGRLLSGNVENRGAMVLRAAVSRDSTGVWRRCGQNVPPAPAMFSACRPNASLATMFGLALRISRNSTQSSTELSPPRETPVRECAAVCAAKIWRGNREYVGIWRAARRMRDEAKWLRGDPAMRNSDSARPPAKRLRRGALTARKCGRECS